MTGAGEQALIFLRAFGLWPNLVEIIKGGLVEMKEMIRLTLRFLHSLRSVEMTEKRKGMTFWSMFGKASTMSS